MARWRDLQSCGEAARCGLPAGFFRLRYFYGKQMRLADYVDEQAYHGGKMRFHNQRLHGAGILCGLRVSLLEPDSLVLRVSRGAAIDDCGHEIVVGYDQCVHVGDWYRAQKDRPRDDDEENPCHPDEENRVSLCVVIRYSECAQAPEPAPRNPCGPPSCECGGCGGSCSCGETACPDPCTDGAEFGRVTEAFELKLMFRAEADRLTEHRLFPAAEAIDSAVAEATGAIGLLQALADPVRAGCPGSEEEWLRLACFDVIVDEEDDGKINEIVDIDHECGSQVLLSTEVIQYLLAGLFAEVDPNIGGPEVADVEFRKLSGQRYQFILTLTGEIDASSLDQDDGFHLRRLQEDGWDPPGSNVVNAKYSDHAEGNYIVDGPALYVNVKNDNGFLAPGNRYHLFTPRDHPPIVDPHLRHLRPRDFTWRFGIEQDPDGGDLVMVPLPQGTEE